jgi:choline dehydrogenase-like flavoprotein
MLEHYLDRTCNGEEIRKDGDERADAVIVGSGPGGATVARALARAGMRVLIVEEGALWLPKDLPADAWTAQAELYRDLGGIVAMGTLPMPLVQGCAVGGTSLINGAISWRLPRDIYDEWVAADPALGEAISWEALEESMNQIERDLHIHPTDPAISGANNLLLGQGAEKLGIEHRPISRNVKGCRGLGRCMQGCPEGHKMSMDRSYLPDALAHNATLFYNTTAQRILHEKGRAKGILAQTKGGATLTLHAPIVIIAAGALHSPLLLWKSGLRSPALGQGFQCHPGVGITGRFKEPVRMWQGATQGHEVIGLRREGIKLEALGFDTTLVASRLKSFGDTLMQDIGDLASWANWGAAIRAEAKGRVKPTWQGRPSIRYSLTQRDLLKIRRAIRIMGEIMFAAGAEAVYPSIAGWHERVDHPAIMARLEDEAPLKPRAYNALATHLFSTCRMGSHPHTNVVNCRFQSHLVNGLYLTDASVFPSNTGVNPQTSILALSRLAAQSILNSL